MASGLMNNDWMFSVKEKPWHGIGTIVQDAPSSEEAIRIAKLDWDVIQYPIYANGKEIPNVFANTRSDTEETLGIVRGRYKVQQNIESFAFVDNIIANEDVACKYETAGSLFNGKRTFLLVKLPESKLLDDTIENYLFFSNSHDGSSGLTAGVSSIRVVCNNTLQLALSTAKRTWRCKHTANMENKKQEAYDSLNLSTFYLKEVEAIANKMVATSVNDSYFMDTLVSLNPLGLGKKNLSGMRENIFNIYNNKDDLQNFVGTSWGMYNAVADFVSNVAITKNSKHKKDANLTKFFDGYKLLDTAQKILMAA